jgi:hypothetical protein
MAIEYDEIDDVTLKNVTDITSKKAAVESELEIVQNERAAAEIGWVEREQELMAEKNRLIGDMRKTRKATVTA